jgi:tRNA-Thr(GGU) m(6)t(6)A37 methyltransferase TsaA
MAEIETVHYRPIGIIHSPFTEPEGVPIQPRFGRGIEGSVEVFPEYEEGLADLVGFSHITLLYHFHRSTEYSLLVRPFLEEEKRGVFATRAPRRPNPIGLSTVRLVKIEGRMLYISDLDVIDGTPLLDIKPYVPLFENPDAVRSGWLTGRVCDGDAPRADGRFSAARRRNEADDILE